MVSESWHLMGKELVRMSISTKLAKYFMGDLKFYLRGVD